MAQQFQFGDYTKNAPLASFVNGYRREQERQRQIKRQQEQDKQAAAKLALEAKVVEQRGKLIENEAAQIALQNKRLEALLPYVVPEAEQKLDMGAANLSIKEAEAETYRPWRNAQIRNLLASAAQSEANAGLTDKRADWYGREAISQIDHRAALTEGEEIKNRYSPRYLRARNEQAEAAADMAWTDADYRAPLYESRLLNENVGRELTRQQAIGQGFVNKKGEVEAARWPTYFGLQIDRLRDQNEQTRAQTQGIRANTEMRRMLNKFLPEGERARIDGILAGIQNTLASTRKMNAETDRYDEIVDSKLAYEAATIRSVRLAADARQILNRFLPEGERARIDGIIAQTGVREAQAKHFNIATEAADFDLQVKRKGQAALDALAAGKGDPGENMTKALISGLPPRLVARIAAMRLSQAGKGAQALIQKQKEKQDAAAKAEAWAAQNKEWAAAADSLADFVSGDDYSFLRVFTTLSPDNPVRKAAEALGWRHFAPAPDAALANKTAASLAKRGETETANAGRLAKEAAAADEQLGQTREEGRALANAINAAGSVPLADESPIAVDTGLAWRGLGGNVEGQPFPPGVRKFVKKTAGGSGGDSKALLPSYQYNGSGADMVALSVSDPSSLWGSFKQVAGNAGAQKVVDVIDKAKAITDNENITKRREGLDVLTSANARLRQLAQAGDVRAFVGAMETLLREAGGGGSFGAALQKWGSELKLTYEGNVMERWSAAVEDFLSGDIPKEQMENIVGKVAEQIELYRQYGAGPMEKARRDMTTEMKSWNLSDAQGRRLPPDQVEAMAINFADYFMGIGNNDQNSVAPERLQQGAGALAQDPATAAATPAAPPPAAGLAQGQSNTGAGESMDKLFANPQQPVGDLPQRMRAAFDKYAEIIGSNNGLNSSQEENASRLFAEAGARAYGIKFGNFAEAQKAFQGAPGWHKMYGLKGEEKMIVGQKTAEPPGLEAVLADLQDVGQDGAPDGVQQIKYYPGQGAFISLELRDNYNNNMPEGGDYPAGIALAWVSEAALKSQDKPQRLANITLFFTNQEPMTAEKLI